MKGSSIVAAIMGLSAAAAVQALPEAHRYYGASMPRRLHHGRTGDELRAYRRDRRERNRRVRHARRVMRMRGGS